MGDEGKTEKCKPSCFLFPFILTAEGNKDFEMTGLVAVLCFASTLGFTSLIVHIADSQKYAFHSVCVVLPVSSLRFTSLQLVEESGRFFLSHFSLKML